MSECLTNGSKILKYVAYFGFSVLLYPSGYNSLSASSTTSHIFSIILSELRNLLLVPFVNRHSHLFQKATILMGMSSTEIRQFSDRSTSSQVVLALLYLYSIFLSKLSSYTNFSTIAEVSYPCNLMFYLSKPLLIQVLWTTAWENCILWYHTLSCLTVKATAIIKCKNVLRHVNQDFWKVSTPSKPQPSSDLVACLLEFL